MVGVSDVNGAVVNPSGLDIPELRRHVDEFGHSLASFPDGEVSGRIYRIAGDPQDRHSLAVGSGSAGLGWAGLGSLGTA